MALWSSLSFSGYSTFLGSFTLFQGSTLEEADLVNSKDYLDILRRLYQEHLKRPPGNNLDPIAIATWGAILYVGQGRPETITAIRASLDMHYRNGAR